MHRPATDRGSATTEVVLLTPVLLFLVMIVIQFGLWYHAQHVAQAAAEQGVQAASAEGSNAVDGQRRAEEFLAHAGPTIVGSPVVVAEREADIAAVTVDGRSVAVIPGLSFTVHATATSPVERFYEDDRAAP